MIRLPPLGHVGSLTESGKLAVEHGKDLGIFCCGVVRFGSERSKAFKKYTPDPARDLLRWDLRCFGVSLGGRHVTVQPVDSLL